MEKLREDDELLELLQDVCDVQILPDFVTPQNENGHLTYNIPGKTFARDGSGSEYILLEDGSVGYWGSEGACGRIADNLSDFFEFMIHCPSWQDYLCESEFQELESLGGFAMEIFREQEEDALERDYDLPQAQKELAECFGISKKDDVTGILMRFYKCAKRNPRFIQTYTEDDGSVHSGTGFLFD